MRIIINLATIGLLVLSSVSANAYIVGNKDWLQVSATYESSWTDFDEIFNTSTGKCDVSDCILNRNQPGDEIQPLIDLTGYTWASNSDVNMLFKSYTDEPGLSSLNSNNTVKLKDEGLFEFFNDFSYTYGDSEGGQTFSRISGWTRNSTANELGVYGDNFWASQFYPNGLYGSDADAFIGLNTQENTVCNSFDCRIQMPGAWLYKIVPDTCKHSHHGNGHGHGHCGHVSVSEPPTVSLLGLTFLCLASIRRRLKRS